MAQEIQQIGRGRGVLGLPAGRVSFDPWSEGVKNQGRLEEKHLDLSHALLNALGDESSRRILNSGITGGKTVEEMSVEQGLPLSTCYRKVRSLIDEDLMILERMVVTKTGKRYAVYRTTISEAKISFDQGRVDVQVTPNPEVLDKLRTRWLSETYPMQNQDDRSFAAPPPCPRPAGRLTVPFE